MGQANLNETKQETSLLPQTLWTRICVEFSSFFIIAKVFLFYFILRPLFETKKN